LSANQWVPFRVDFNDIVAFDVFGKKVPVIKANDLICYMNMLKRDIDVLDVNELVKLL
jgi:hypothetical protein